MNRFLSYFILFFVTCAFNSSAQDGSAKWFNETIVRIETLDTVGLEKELSVPLTSSASAEDQFRHQAAYCYILLYPERHPDSKAPFDRCLSLDSLVRADSLHTLATFIHGYYYFGMYNYAISMEFLNKAALEWNDTVITMFHARCFMLRSNIMQDLGHAEESEKCMRKALGYYQRNGYTRKEASVYNNIALLRNSKGDTANAFALMWKSLALRDSIQDISGMGQCYNNFGTLHYGLGHYDSALYYFKRGLDFRIRGNAPVTGLIESRINIGKTLFKLGRPDEAVDTLEKCLEVSIAGGHSELQRRTADQLRTIYASLGNYDKAYAMQAMYYTLQDTMYSRSLKEDIIRRNVEYDFRNREREEQIRQQEKEQRTNIIMIALGAGLILAGIFVYNLFRSNQQKKRSNAIISQQRDILDKKQQEITESITYARYIQQTLLPEDVALASSLKEHFILYLPKDIVSGDFYWLKSLKNNSVLVAAADCTGHGVPGAFMSLLAKENLDKSAVTSDHPGEILSALNRGVKQALRQGNEAQSGIALRDGLDIALVQIEGKTIRYAGANRPLWIYRSATKAMEEIKATKCAIGGMTPDEQVYAETNMRVEPGDMLYLFTDGFADQFGGEKKKKLTTRKFREKLTSVSQLSAADQRKSLSEFFSAWKADEAQIDDVLVIGVRIA